MEQWPLTIITIHTKKMCDSVNESETLTFHFCVSRMVRLHMAADTSVQW